MFPALQSTVLLRRPGGQKFIHQVYLDKVLEMISLSINCYISRNKQSLTPEFEFFSILNRALLVKKFKEFCFVFFNFLKLLKVYKIFKQNNQRIDILYIIPQLFVYKCCISINMFFNKIYFKKIFFSN